MSMTLLSCPKCGSSYVVKNGKIHNGKQNFKCRDCGRQFVQYPENKVIDTATKELIDKLLLERISLAGIARVAGVSEPWLHKYVQEKQADITQQVEIQSGKNTSDSST